MTKKMRTLVIGFILIDLIIFAVIAAGAYVRLAPTNAEDWHVPVTATSDADMRNGVVRVISGGQEDFARLDEMIQQTPRTSVLAGSLEEGRITYVTRSLIWGFPDYATVELNEEDTLTIHSRLRFGHHDLGVNKERVEGWLASFNRSRSL